MLTVSGFFALPCLHCAAQKLIWRFVAAVSPRPEECTINVSQAAAIEQSAPKQPLPFPSVDAKPLRIALLGYRSLPHGGGQGVYLRYLSKALVDAGHRVDVISGPPYPHLDARVELIKLPSLDLFENGLGSLRLHHLCSLSNIIEWISKLTGGFAEPLTFGRRAVKYLRQHGHNYDLVHDNQSLSYGMLTIQAMGIPLVTTVHHPVTSDERIALAAATDWKERLLIKRWHSFLNMQRKVIKKLRHVVTVSSCSRDDISRDFELDASKIHLAYNGIDTDVFQPRPHIQRLPLRLMATASADAPLKGVRYLLRAYAELLKEFPELELLMVSKLQEGGETEQLVESLGLTDKITFVSNISTEKMVDYYAQATITVVPSVYEGFGLPAGEAMACGVPVISTTGGALPEVVGDAGVLVPTKDAKALAQAIAKLLRDPDRREQLGRLARERIERQFCWQVTAANMVDYYRQVIISENR